MLTFPQGASWFEAHWHHSPMHAFQPVGGGGGSEGQKRLLGCVGDREGHGSMKGHCGITMESTAHCCTIEPVYTLDPEQCGRPQHWTTDQKLVLFFFFFFFFKLYDELLLFEYCNL